MLTLILAALTLYLGDENAALAGKGKVDSKVVSFAGATTDDLIARLDETLGRSAKVLAHGDHKRSGKRNGLYRLVAGKILVIFGMNTAVKPEG